MQYLFTNLATTPAVVTCSVECLLHKKCHVLAVDWIPLGETIPALSASMSPFLPLMNTCAYGICEGLPGDPPHVGWLKSDKKIISTSKQEASQNKNATYYNGKLHKINYNFPKERNWWTF